MPFLPVPALGMGAHSTVAPTWAEEAGPEQQPVPGFMWINCAGGGGHTCPLFSSVSLSITLWHRLHTLLLEL